MAQQFQQTNPAAEVEGASKSKAQLIVGIDFVCLHTGCHSFPPGPSLTSLPHLGNDILRRCIRFCY